MSAKYELQASADPTVTRIIPDLAKEIGLNESIFLLQMAFWIKGSAHEVDGEFWSFQSVRDMQEKAFSYWSVDTVNRTANAVVKAGYLKARADLNTRKGDKTRWFALNVEKLRTLTSISIIESAAKPVRKSDTLSENKTGLYESQTPSSENRTTLPKTPTEIKSTTTSIPKEGIEVPPPENPKPAKRPSPHEPEYRELLKADHLKAETMTNSADSAYWQVAAELRRAAFPVERIGELAEYVQRRARGENWKSHTVRTYAKYAPDFLRDCPRIRLLPEEPPSAAESPPSPLSEAQLQQAEQAIAGIISKFGGKREQQPAKA